MSGTSQNRMHSVLRFSCFGSTRDGFLGEGLVLVQVQTLPDCQPGDPSVLGDVRRLEGELGVGGEHVVPEGLSSAWRTLRGTMDTTSSPLFSSNVGLCFLFFHAKWFRKGVWGYFMAIK